MMQVRKLFTSFFLTLSCNYTFKNIQLCLPESREDRVVTQVLFRRIALVFELTLLLSVLQVQAFKLGIENISPEVLKRLQNGKVGLVTNQTGVDQEGNRTVDILRSKGVHVRTIFVPEHGLNGTISAACYVPNAVESNLNIPVISLYGHGVGKIDKDAFACLDMIVLDLQDVGMRHYTYISTMYKVMEEAARIKKPIVVLDRPNLLGAVMEGPICLPQLRSFIGIAQIPLRHGMTIGELAQFFNVRSLTHKADLTVVPMADYSRSMLLPELHAHLSPNIKTMASVYGYSFLGLVGEVEPFHIGVGTSDAFQIIMLPKDFGISSDIWQELQHSLEELGVQSRLEGAYHLAKKKDFEGLKLYFENMNNISGFKALMTVLSWTKKNAIPVCFKAVFDKSVGTSEVRRWYQSNKPFEAFMQTTKQSVLEFLNENSDMLLYDELPKVVRRAGFFDVTCV